KEDGKLDREPAKGVIYPVYDCVLFIPLQSKGPEGVPRGFHLLDAVFCFLSQPVASSQTAPPISCDRHRTSIIAFTLQQLRNLLLRDVYTSLSAPVDGVRRPRDKGAHVVRVGSYPRHLVDAAKGAEEIAFSLLAVRHVGLRQAEDGGDAHSSVCHNKTTPAPRETMEKGRSIIAMKPRAFVSTQLRFNVAGPQLSLNFHPVFNTMAGIRLRRRKRRHLRTPCTEEAGARNACITKDMSISSQPSETLNHYPTPLTYLFIEVVTPQRPRISDIHHVRLPIAQHQVP
ncbi:hypothetical protein L249_5028, partial [Ophiocordyceps polyrhachis-furcata BCC 54312]